MRKVTIFCPATHVWRKVFLKKVKLAGSVEINAFIRNSLRVPNDLGTRLGQLGTLSKRKASKHNGCYDLAFGVKKLVPAANGKQCCEKPC